MLENTLSSTRSLSVTRRPDLRLFREVIWLAVRDAHSKVGDLLDSKDRQKARDWTDTQDFLDVCHMAELDPDSVKTVILESDRSFELRHFVPNTGRYNDDLSRNAEANRKFRRRIAARKIRTHIAAKV
jgi:hypothetical protein